MRSGSHLLPRGEQCYDNKAWYSLKACMRYRSPPAGHQSTREIGRAGDQGCGAAHISSTMDFGSSQQSVRSQALAWEGAERGKQRRARNEDNRKGRGRRKQWGKVYQAQTERRRRAAQRPEEGGPESVSFRGLGAGRARTTENIAARSIMVL